MKDMLYDVGTRAGSGGSSINITWKLLASGCLGSGRREVLISEACLRKRRVIKTLCNREAT